MNEFGLIDRFFASIPHQREDVIFGIGDDAACLQIPNGKQLVVSTDTLVSGVHFLDTWPAYDIATKAVMSNVSDIAAMGALPCWMLLSITIPELDESWLSDFSKGLQEAMAEFNIALIGGDTTRGPLCITITIHGLVDSGKAILRNGAKAGDLIYVSGMLGAAAAGLLLINSDVINKTDLAVLTNKLHRPTPRVDYQPYLSGYAHAAIDISDGLSADLAHICKASQVGACLYIDQIPIHPLVQQYLPNEALQLALSGGDDYELCFTISPTLRNDFHEAILHSGLMCYPIGVIESELGLRAQTTTGEILPCASLGFRHF